MYNSEMLEQKKSEAMMNVIVVSAEKSDVEGQGAAVQLMFPAIYKLSCKMNVSVLSLFYITGSNANFGA